MKFKVMVTGRMETIVTDVRNHLERDRGYNVLTCIPSRRELFGTYLAELPQVIIVCLRNESGETVSVYNILKDYEAEDAAKIVVIASYADRTVFMAHTGLREITFLPRPLSLSALYYKLKEFEEDWEANGGKLVGEGIETVKRDNPIRLPKKHILVVDDDPEQLSQIKEHLREFYDVTLAVNAKAAFKCLSKYQVDLILLDYIMPGTDGVQVLHMLRSIPDFKIPVVFLTGVSERDKVAKIIQDLKPEGFVLKPTKKSDLVARIIEVLG